MLCKDYEQLLEAINNKSHFRYLKRGSRYLMEGHILYGRTMIRGEYQKVAVRFDNGMYQEYSVNAFLGNEYGDAYLEIVMPTKGKPENTINNFIVTDNKGSIMEFTGTSEEALAFAQEQVYDSTGLSSFYIFRKAFVVSTKRPEVEVTIFP